MPVCACPPPLHQFFNYRPQTKFTKVMFLHLSVSHSVHRGGACVAGGYAWQGVMCGRGGHACRGVCVAGGVHGRGRGMHGRRGVCVAGGVCVVGGICGGGVCMAGGMYATHIPRHYEIQSVNARAVHILLECILVSKDFSSVRNLGSVPELLRTFRDFILHFENKILAINKNLKFGCVAVVPCVSD